MGANHIDDSRIGGVDMGIRGPGPRGSVRASNVESRLLLDSGNVVLAALMNISLATLVCLSVISLVFSAYHGLVIRDAAASAASKSAKAEATEQQQYLLRLLDKSLPALASYQTEFSGNSRFVQVRVESVLPGFGLVQAPNLSYQGLAARESVE